MPRRLKVLDLFCGAGGAALGLLRAGADVEGIDIEPQPNYPAGFTQMNVLDLNPYWVRAKKFDLVWASPPCQKFTRLRTAPNAKKHKDLITPTRRILKKIGIPYCIENVVGAPLRHPVKLCGSHFDLGADGYHLERHRLFECTFPVPQPKCRHKKPVIGVYGGHVRCRSAAYGGRRTRDFEDHDKPALAARALDVSGMTMEEMSQAIPPAYSAHILEAFRHWRASEGKR